MSELKHSSFLGKALLASVFVSAIFGAASASAYTITYNANGALFDNGQETNEVAYDESGNIVSGEYKKPDMHNPVEYELYWSLEQNGKTEFNVASIKSDVTVYAQYIYVRWDYNYTGSGASFSAPMDKRYILEAWGAEGGGFSTASYGNAQNPGGKGGFSIGALNLDKDSVLHITVGGTTSDLTGGYNGGGNGNSASQTGRGGGGATHIATVPGLLNTLENNIEDILLVAGGGGGSSYDKGSSGGGVQGVVGPDLYMKAYYNTTSVSWYGAFPGTQISGGAARGLGSSAGSFGQGGQGGRFRRNHQPFEG